MSVGSVDRPDSNGVLHSESREVGAPSDLPASVQEITSVVQSVFAGGKLKELAKVLL